MLQRTRLQANPGVTSSRGRSTVENRGNYIQFRETSAELYESWVGKIYIDDPRIIHTRHYISSGYISHILYPNIYRILYVYMNMVKSVPSKAYEEYRVNIYIDAISSKIIDVRCF